MSFMAITVWATAMAITRIRCWFMTVSKWLNVFILDCFFTVCEALRLFSDSIAAYWQRKQLNYLQKMYWRNEEKSIAMQFT